MNKISGAKKLNSQNYLKFQIELALYIEHAKINRIGSAITVLNYKGGVIPARAGVILRRR